MTRRAYEQLIDGEPESFVVGEYSTEACCDCGAVHQLKMEVIESENGSIRKVLVRRWKDARRTAQTRRWMKKKREGMFER